MRAPTSDGLASQYTFLNLGGPDMDMMDTNYSQRPSEVEQEKSNFELIQDNVGSSSTSATAAPRNKDKFNDHDKVTVTSTSGNLSIGEKLYDVPEY